MSVFCHIDTTLKLEYDPKNIKKLLERGHSLGWVYYKGISNQVIKIDEALHVVLNIDLDNVDEMVFLQAKIKDTYVDIFCDKSPNNFLEVDFSLAASLWKKKYLETDSEELNMPRYLQEILPLLKPYKILKVNFRVEY